MYCILDWTAQVVRLEPRVRVENISRVVLVPACCPGYQAGHPEARINTSVDGCVECAGDGRGVFAVLPARLLARDLHLPLHLHLLPGLGRPELRGTRLPAQQVKVWNR